MYTRKKEPRSYVKWMKLKENEEYKARYLLIISTATQRPCSRTPPPQIQELLFMQWVSLTLA
jgi:hypothetical protein